MEEGLTEEVIDDMIGGKASQLYRIPHIRCVITNRVIISQIHVPPLLFSFMTDIDEDGSGWVDYDEFKELMLG